VSAAFVGAVNSFKAAFRNVAPGAGGRTMLAFAACSILAFVACETVALGAVLRVARLALAELPGLRTDFLLQRVLSGGFAAAALLLVLGSLTTAVSTLFLSDELPILIALPVPHHGILARQLALTLAVSSAPTLLLAGPLVMVAASASGRPVLAAVTAGAAVLAVVLLAGCAGASLALFLVRVIPPRRARLLAAFLSAAGLASVLIGFRGARPERLLDPQEALAILSVLGETPPDAPGLNPIALASRAATGGLLGDDSGLVLGSALLASSVVLFALVARLLAPMHLHVWQLTRETDTTPTSAARRRRPVRSLGRALLGAEAATLLRDASTPAQIGSLAAVFVLYLLNLRLLPSTDAAARDLVAGLQTGVALFLVSALSLRFAYPSVSGDGRAALVLRTLPLSPVRHLAARYAVRGIPSVVMALVLVGASLGVLRPGRGAVVAALTVSLGGAIALPALNLGLGALFPRYDAPNAVSVALGAGGLVALTLSTALSLGSTIVVSSELRSVVGALLRAEPKHGPLLFGWLLAALLLGGVPMFLARRSLARNDLPTS
jgi:ABC-2 type transport system permease protein